MVIFVKFMSNPNSSLWDTISYSLRESKEDISYDKRDRKFVIVVHCGIEVVLIGFKWKDPVFC